jgi:hypothetical protein
MSRFLTWPVSVKTYRVVELMSKLDVPCYDAKTRRMFSVKKPPCYAGTSEEQASRAEFDKVMMRGEGQDREEPFGQEMAPGSRNG